VVCDIHGVIVANVPWARHGAGHTDAYWFPWRASPWWDGGLLQMSHVSLTDRDIGEA